MTPLRGDAWVIHVVQLVPLLHRVPGRREGGEARGLVGSVLLSGLESVVLGGELLAADRGDLGLDACPPDATVKHLDAIDVAPLDERVALRFEGGERLGALAGDRVEVSDLVSDKGRGAKRRGSRRSFRAHV